MTQEQRTAEILIGRLETFYDFECQGGQLKNCVDWKELKYLLLQALESKAGARD